MTRVQYSVAPRYGAGSPACVDQATAEQVMHHEREVHARILEGAYGEVAKVAAELPHALRGIALAMLERGGRWFIQDLVTDERFEEVALSKVPIGGECWPYTGHANRDLSMPPHKRPYRFVLQPAVGHPFTVTGDTLREYPVLIRVRS